MDQEVTIALFVLSIITLCSSMCGVSASNHLRSVCSPTDSALPYCSCVSLTKHVNCSSQNRTIMPSGIPSNTQSLYIKNNDIYGLKKGEFQNLEALRTLDLSHNAITTIEKGTFDRLYRLVELFLSFNRLQVIDSYFFRHLASLRTIDLSHNQIIQVAGSAFVTLPSILNINMANNDLQCGCESKKLNQWLQLMPTVVLNATCANLADSDIMDFTDDKCTATLFPSSTRCRLCANVRSHEECIAKGSITRCKRPKACYTELQYNSNGVHLWKSCDSYATTLTNSRRTNPRFCYEQNRPLQCEFFCLGDLCNDDDIGGRIHVLNFNVTMVIDSEMNPAIKNTSSAEYQKLFELGAQEVEKKLENSPYGTFIIKFLSYSEPNTTASFSVECVTFLIAKAEHVFDYLSNQASYYTQLLQNITVVKFEITSSDVCTIQNATRANATYFWPSTGISDIARAGCSNSMTGKYAYRPCNSLNGLAEWGTIDHSECQYEATLTSKFEPTTDTVFTSSIKCTDLTPMDCSTATTTASSKSTAKTTVADNKLTSTLSELSNRTITDENAEQISSDLKSVSAQASQYSGLDLNLTVSKLEELINYKSNISQPGRNLNIARTMSNVLESSSKSMTQSENEFKTLTRLTEIIQEFVDEVNLEGSNFSAVNPNLALFAFNISGSDFSGFTLQADVRSDEQLVDSRVTVEEGNVNIKSNDVSSVVIPQSLVEEIGDSQLLSRITFSVFLRGNIFSEITNSSGKLKHENAYKTAPNSLVLSASIPNVEVKNLTNPVILKFIHKQQNAINPACSFWDVNNTWSGTGCDVMETVESKYTLCGCNHFTNFALVMDIYGTGGSIKEPHQKALSLISYFGCGISFLGLLFTLICYLKNRSAKSSNPSTILMINLCVALAVTNLIFIVGQQNYAFKNRIGCKVVAIAMHYFLLSAVVLMGIEAAFIYRALVKIWNAQITRVVLTVCLPGWGIPFIIVVITIIIDSSDNYGLQAGEICWLRDNAFYGAFLAPVLAILLWNFTAFVFIARVLWGCTAERNLTKSQHSEMTDRVRRITSVVVLFGLTWAFSLFTIDEHGVVFQYLFAIFNSLQGFFIFLFYCVLSKQMKTFWKKLLPCCKRSEYESTSQSTTECKTSKDAVMLRLTPTSS